MKFTTTIFLTLFSGALFGQTLVQSIPTINVLGATKLANEVIVASVPAKNELKLTAIDNNGDTRWETTQAIEDISGYNFNKMRILGNEKVAAIIFQYSKYADLLELDLKTGELLSSSKVSLKSGESSYIWGMSGSHISMYTTANDQLQEFRLNTDGDLDKRVVTSLPKRYPADKFKAHFVSNSKVLTTSRVLVQNYLER